MKRNSLKGCIRNKITLDEFEPKCGQDSEVVVVAFYAIDEEPAIDLDRFLQHGYLQIIDSEVSPNPDENGDYLVFVEIERNKRFWEILNYLLTEVENLTGKMDWIVKPYIANRFFQLDDPKLRSYLFVIQKEKKSELGEFVESANFNCLSLEGDYVIIENRIRGKLQAFEEHNSALSKVNLTESAINILDIPTECNALTYMFGSNYSVTSMDRYIVISNGDKALVLSDVEFL